ncbi:MAG: hypothetical protein IPP73_12535 [Chitinophagaceae bacterium]|nr:hypothetical protein [Chitinophagaceae bacterium]
MSALLFVRVPVIATDPIEVIVDPEFDFAVPLNVCNPVPRALKPDALFIKLPPKLYVLFAPLPVEGSFQTEPVLKVISPVKLIALAVALVEAKLIVPK